MSKSIAFDVKKGDLKLCIENAMRDFRHQDHKGYVIACIVNLHGPSQDYRKGMGLLML